MNSQTNAGETFDLYFPAYIHCRKDPQHIYKMASTTPTITDSTIFVDFISLMLYVNQSDGRHIRAWRGKYLKLFQEQPEEPEKPHIIQGTSNIWVVFDKERNPVKAYSAVEDCIKFITNKPYSNQQVYLHYKYRSDSIVYTPGQIEILEDLNHPELLTDEFLAKKTIYVVMQNHFQLASAAYHDLNDCIDYADKFGLKYVAIPYFYRTKKSYDEIHRIRKKRLGMD